MAISSVLRLPLPPDGSLTSLEGTCLKRQLRGREIKFSISVTSCCEWVS